MTETHSTRDLIADAILNAMWRGEDTVKELADAALAVLSVEWGVRIDGHDKPRHCTEHAAWLAAPDETPVSRVVGPWQNTIPNPPGAKP